MSNERTPILSGAIPSFEMFMSRWEKLMTEHPHLKHLFKPGLDLAYEYYTRMDHTRAYIVAMCKCNWIVLQRNIMIWSAVLNPSIRMSLIRSHWDQDYIKQAEEKIRETVRHSVISA